MPSSSPDDVSKREGFADLRRKLVWVNVFRIIATTLFLVAIAFRLLSAVPTPELTREDSVFFGLIGLVYFVTLAYGVFLRFGRASPALAYGEVMGDVVLGSALVYLSGGVESPFTFVYLLAIVAASTLLFQRGALVGAIASAGAFVSLTMSIQSGILRAPAGRYPVSHEHFAFVLSSNLLAQFLLAVLAGYLSRQLRAAGGRLSEREADLRQLSELQNQIVACMPSGLATCDAEGRIIFVNPAGRAILGIESADAPPRTIAERFPGIRSLGSAVPRGELEIRTPTGPKTIGLTVTPLQGREGYTLLVFQDLTHLRRIEEDLRRADRLAALGRLSAQLAHEIRNPLASMRGSAQMLASDPGAGSGRLANILVRESDRLSALVEDFLRFARPPAPALQPVSLEHVVSETLEVLSTDPLVRNIAIETRLSDAVVHIDPDQFRQVLMNLLRNAFSAVSGGGTVRVSTEVVADKARVHVWDSAGAVAPEDRLRLFEPFFTKRPGGTGLGLSSAHAIVRAHGGTIQVSSSREAGTDFAVEIPLRAEDAVASPGR